MQKVTIFQKNNQVIPSLDAVINLGEMHQFDNVVATQVLENGSPITDHIAILPDQLEITLFVSNVDGDNKPLQGENARNVYAAIKGIRNKRELIEVLTLHELYTNMAITSITMNHDAPWKGRLNITVRLQKIDITNQNIEHPRSQFEDETVDIWGKIRDDFQKKKNGGETSQKDIVESGSSILDNGQSAILSAFASAYVYVDDLMSEWGINDLIAMVGDAWDEVSGYMDDIWDGIRFLQNISIGAQRIYANVLGKIGAFTTYFNILYDAWTMDVQNSVGEDILVGVVLAPGMNVFEGLGINVSDTIGNIMMTGQPGTEKSPYAFYPGPVENSACALITMSDKAYKSFQILEQKARPIKPLNFNINDMDYTIV